MLHIGEKIKEIFEKSGMTVSEFGRRLNSSRENVYGIFKRKSIDTDLLVKISHVLDFNFFSFYMNIVNGDPEKEELKKQLEVADREIVYLKKINQLLENEVGKRKE